MTNNNIFIRGYQENDRAQVQKICLVTGSEQEVQQKEQQDMLLTAFCNYYIDKEPYNCFVAMEDEKAVGYILCAEDSNIWAEYFQNNYVANLENSPLTAFYRGIMVSPLRYANEYPAHLHIDILPDYQRMGIGFNLMNALLSHLKAKGVQGLMLSVASDNIKGINFYEKYGFTILAHTPHEIMLGMHLK